MPDNGFEPRIVAFLCNWCTYTGADLAGTSRLQYPPNVRIIRLMCSGAVDASYVLKPLLDGADGVLIGGCHPGDCHYQTGNYKTRRRYVAMREILKELEGKGPLAEQYIQVLIAQELRENSKLIITDNGAMPVIDLRGTTPDSEPATVP